MSTLTISEVYFLVRVGTWGEAELAQYIQGFVEAANKDIDRENRQAWRDGYNEGHQAGLNSGSGYTEDRW